MPKKKAEIPLCSWCKVVLTEENTSKGALQCKPCRKEYRKKYYEKKKDIEVQRSVDWASENRERVNEYKRTWRKYLASEESKKKLRETQKRANLKQYHGEFAPVREEIKKVEQELREIAPTCEQLRYRKRAEYHRAYYRARRKSKHQVDS